MPSAKGWAEGEAIQGKALAELQEKGVTIHRWSQDILDTLEEKWNEVGRPRTRRVTRTSPRSGNRTRRFAAEYAVWNNLGYLN